MRHRHSWILIHTTYAPPSPLSGMSVKDIYPVAAHKILLGVTSYQYSCLQCGSFRTDELLGKEV